MNRYRFLRRPRWVAFSAAVLILVVVMVNLSLWQLRRLSERRDRNDRITQAQAADPEPVDSDRELSEWRRVTATGTYDATEEVLIRNRSLQGRPGYHVVTPLRLDDGRALLVNRGWIPLEDDVGTEASIPPPPAGRLTVSGRVRASQHRGRFFSPTDPADGRLRQLYRVDVDRIGEQVPYVLLPAYVELISTVPPPSEPDAQPVPVPAPALDDGPHLSYAGQWMLFAACAIGGWILVVRRTARSGTSTGKGETPTDGPGGDAEQRRHGARHV